jgi:hypothetical protein
MSQYKSLIKVKASTVGIGSNKLANPIHYDALVLLSYPALPYFPSVDQHFELSASSDIYAAAENVSSSYPKKQ